jgi:hypothetical protein
MKSECDFYLDRAAKCLDMAEYLDKQYRGDLVQIARGWVQLAQEEAEWDTELGEDTEFGESVAHPASPDSQVSILWTAA